jgi:hypothetical protein
LQATVTSTGGTTGVTLGWHPAWVLGDPNKSRLTLSGIAAVGVLPGQAPPSGNGSVTATAGPLLEYGLGGPKRELAKWQLGGFLYGSYTQYLPVGNSSPQSYLANAAGVGGTFYAIRNFKYVGTTPRYVLFGEVSGRYLGGSLVGGPPLAPGASAGSGSSATGQGTAGGIINFISRPDQTVIPSVGLFVSGGVQSDDAVGPRYTTPTWATGVGAGIAF